MAEGGGAGQHGARAANGAVEAALEHGDEEGVLGGRGGDERAGRDGVPEAVELVEDDVEERERGAARRVAVQREVRRAHTRGDGVRGGPEQKVRDHVGTGLWGASAGVSEDKQHGGEGSGCPNGKADVWEREERGEGLEGGAGVVGRRELCEEGRGDGTGGGSVLGDERQQLAQLGGAERSHSLGGPGRAQRQRQSQKEKKEENSNGRNVGGCSCCFWGRGGEPREDGDVQGGSTWS